MKKQRTQIEKKEYVTELIHDIKNYPDSVLEFSKDLVNFLKYDKYDKEPLKEAKYAEILKQAKVLYTSLLVKAIKGRDDDITRDNLSEYSFLADLSRELVEFLAYEKEMLKEKKYAYIFKSAERLLELTGDFSSIARDLEADEVDDTLETYNYPAQIRKDVREDLSKETIDAVEDKLDICLYHIESNNKEAVEKAFDHKILRERTREIKHFFGVKKWQAKEIKKVTRSQRIDGSWLNYKERILECIEVDRELNKSVKEIQDEVSNFPFLPVDLDIVKEDDCNQAIKIDPNNAYSYIRS